MLEKAPAYSVDSKGDKQASCGTYKIRCIIGRQNNKVLQLYPQNPQLYPQNAQQKKEAGLPKTWWLDTIKADTSQNIKQLKEAV